MENNAVESGVDPKIPSSKIDSYVPVILPTPVKKGRPVKYKTIEEKREARKIYAMRSNSKPFIEMVEQVEEKLATVQQHEIITTRRIDKLTEMIRDQEKRLSQLIEIIQQNK